MGQAKRDQRTAAKPLGTTTGFVANGSTGGPVEQADVVARRFRLLDVARRLRPADKRLNACLRQLAHGVGFVTTRPMDQQASGGCAGAQTASCARSVRRPWVRPNGRNSRRGLRPALRTTRAQCSS
jgi:hypothetical protein